MTDRSNMLCILKILEEYSDAEHVLSMKDILQKLETLYDNKADRRTVYSAIDALTDFGYEISRYEDNGTGYYLQDRIFSNAEIRLLIDAVFSCEYISKQQTEELLRKLRGFVSVNERKHFNYSNIVAPEKKSSNPQVFLNIEILDEAISDRKKISFTYMDYDYDKTLQPRRKERYIANPYMMICENARYYLVAITNRHPEIGYYRIDMMKDIQIMEEKIDISRQDARLGSVRKVVYAFSGEPESIHMHCEKKALRYVIERFGSDAVLQKNADGTFEAYVSAAEQGVVYWALQYLDSVEVKSPQSLRNEIIRILNENKYQ